MFCNLKLATEFWREKTSLLFERSELNNLIFQERVFGILLHFIPRKSEKLAKSKVLYFSVESKSTR